MKITSIQGENIKGQTFTHPLKPVTLIVGDNYSGKSARIEAVKLALLGYVPGLGRRPQDIFALATGTSMATSVTDEAGTVTRREWRLENGAVKASQVAMVAVPPVLLDTREYFEKTAAERLQYVFEKVPSLGPTVTEASVIADLRALRPEAPNEHHEAEIDEVIAIASELSQQREVEEATLQEWLSRLLEELRNNLKEKNAVLKSMVGVVSGTAQLKAAEPLRPPPANVDAEIARLSAELRAAQDKLVMLAGQRTAHEDWTRSRAQWERELKAAGDYAAQIKQLEAEAATLAEKIKAHVDRAPAAALESRNKAAAASEVQGQAAGLRVQITDLDAEYEATLKHERCPTCNSKGKSWKAAFKAKYKAESERLNKAYNAATAEAKEARAEFDKSEKALKAAQKENVRNHENILRSQEVAQRLQSLRASQELVTTLKTKISATKEPPLPDPREVRAMEANVADLGGRLTELQQQARAAAAANQDALRQAQARAKQEQLRAEIEVLKLAIAKLTEIQERLVDVTFQKLLETARLFTDGILGFELRYQGSELGYTKDGQWVSHWTFSGSEQLLAYAGLSVALAQDAGYKIVIMDELGRLAAGTKAKLLARMLELTRRGVIDSFIGVDTADAFPAFKKDADIGVIEVVS